MDKNFYYGTVTIQAPDHVENPITFAIATSANQANGLARRDVQATLLEGWAIVEHRGGYQARHAGARRRRSIRVDTATRT